MTTRRSEGELAGKLNNVRTDRKISRAWLRKKVYR